MSEAWIVSLGGGGRPDFIYSGRPPNRKVLCRLIAATSEQAALIARAPDLDAALREAVEAMERSERVLATLDLPPGSTPLVADLRAVVGRCRAALGEG